ncbi:MAG TPA: PKD domain-containing protein [Chitinophagaceae bacterium]|nr:PKD domain-containing protein [Chitinophagaceae bacterium]
MKFFSSPFVIILCLFTATFIGCKKEGAVEPLAKPTASFAVAGDGVKSPCTITFTNQSQNAQRYVWNFGDGSLSNATIPQVPHQYDYQPRDTTFKVMLIAYNNAGDSAIFTRNVVVKKGDVIPAGQKPIANFEFKDNSGGTFEAPCTVAFTSTSQYVTKGYKWEFGDAAKSTAKAKDTVFMYTTPGNYTVTLEVTNENGVAFTTKSITIIAKGTIPPPANVAFTYTPSNPKAGIIDTVRFTANPNITNAAKYIWNFGDGKMDSTTGANVKHLYADGGTKTATLVVKNNAGVSSAVASQQIKVLYPDAVASFSMSTGPYSIVSAVKFTSTSINAVSYTWSFDDVENASKTPTVTYRFATPGMHTIKLVVTNLDGSPSVASTQIITVNDVSKVSITALKLVDAPLENSVMGTMYEWDAPGGNGDQNSTQPDFFTTILYSGGGTYKSSTMLNRVDPVWTGITATYNKADFNMQYSISLTEASTKVGSITQRLACNTIKFKPADYTAGYPSYIEIGGTSPYGEKVTIGLTLKWE